jgi:hypothetical protein
MKVTTSGGIARLNEKDRFLFHNFDAESISDALRRTIKPSTAATLISDTLTVVNALIDDVVLVINDNMWLPIRIEINLLDQLSSTLLLSMPLKKPMEYQLRSLDKNLYFGHIAQEVLHNKQLPSD